MFEPGSRSKQTSTFMLPEDVAAFDKALAPAIHGLARWEAHDHRTRAITLHDPRLLTPSHWLRSYDRLQRKQPRGVAPGGAHECPHPRAALRRRRQLGTQILKRGNSVVHVTEDYRSSSTRQRR
jgi:hypothetical protein